MFKEEGIPLEPVKVEFTGISLKKIPLNTGRTEQYLMPFMEFYFGGIKCSFPSSISKGKKIWPVHKN